jgi:hypothetical protein
MDDRITDLRDRVDSGFSPFPRLLIVGGATQAWFLYLESERVENRPQPCEMLPDATMLSIKHRALRKRYVIGKMELRVERDCFPIFGGLD